jgi:hypothetical protein
MGQTEANLADLFREGASLPAGHADARAEWEVSRTNALLVRIEAFPDVLLCTTNRLEAWDDAVLRCFAHKAPSGR